MNLIQLRDGPLLREDAVMLALELEAAGHTMTIKNGVLEVSRGSALTQRQRHQIHTCKRHIMALLAYEPPEPR
jgi:hypothetical protein